MSLPYLLTKGLIRICILSKDFKISPKYFHLCLQLLLSKEKEMSLLMSLKLFSQCQSEYTIGIDLKVKKGGFFLHIIYKRSDKVKEIYFRSFE